MTRAAPLLGALNAGELSPLMSARVDVDKRLKGLALCRDAVPLLQGAVTRRGGSYFTVPVKEPSVGARLLPFRFSADQAYQLELGAGYIRFFRDYGQVVSLKAVTGAVNNGAGLIRLTVTAHGFSTGWTVAVASVGGVPAATGTWIVTVINANTIDLQGSAFAGAYTAGGTATGIVEVSTPYTILDVLELSVTQSADVFYIAHQSYQSRKLARLSDVSWTLSLLETTEGPFQKINKDQAVTVQASAATGAGITLTATGGSPFTADMVGALFYLETKDAGGVKPWETSRAMSSGDVRRNDGKYYEAQNNETTGPVAPVHTEGDFNDGGGASNGVLWRFLHSGYGWVKIVGFTSGTVVTADVVSRLPSAVVSSGTYKWAKPAFYGGNWPGAVAFFQQRLVLAGTPLQPDTLWCSVVGDFENFAARDKGGRVVADQAVTVTLASSEVNGVRWLAADARGLLLGTVGAEHVIGQASQAEGFGPNNARATPQSSWGSARVRAERVGSATLMVEAGQRTIRELIYSFDNDRYTAIDMLVLANHFTEAAAITQIAWQQKPRAILWAALSDGKLLGLTYNREQQVIGAHLHDLSGAVESVSAIPSPDVSRDDLWVVVKRTIDGQVTRYVEYLKPFWSRELQQDQAMFLDCALSYDGWNADAAKTLALSGGGAWTEGQSKTLTAAGHAPFVSGDVGRRWRLRDGTGFAGAQVDVEATAFTDSTHLTVTLISDAPAALQGPATSDWARMTLNPTGFDHLEGATVQIVADGFTHPDRVVAAGALSGGLLDWAARVHVGLHKKPMIETLPLEAGAQDGTAQGKLKRIDQIVFRLLDTASFHFGRRGKQLVPALDRPAAFAMNRAPALYSGDLARAFPGGYDRDAKIYIEVTDPLPFTLVSIMPRLKTEDRP